MQRRDFPFFAATGVLAAVGTTRAAEAAVPILGRGHRSLTDGPIRGTWLGGVTVYAAAQDPARNVPERDIAFTCSGTLTFDRDGTARWRGRKAFRFTSVNAAAIPGLDGQRPHDPADPASWLPWTVECEMGFRWVPDADRVILAQIPGSWKDLVTGGPVAGLRYEIDLVAPPPAEIPDGGPAFAEGSFSKVDGILFLTTYGATSMETRTRIVSTSDGSALSVHTTFFTMHLVGAMREQA